ncbi:MAG: aspartyl protease family protein [Candidatus Heimdallarchaeota archaeon]|nr:aspartyl protease family protein [Candidatus Heimdallarchaeota archaeon]MBY8995678.1 aspartyl protease family protein [Candidatus Heimdallarchaeota archaeon]
MAVNFKLDESSNHIRLDVYVNKEGPFNFILDTGAKATSISKNLAEKLGIETLDMEVEDISVSIPHKIALLEELRIANETYENEDVLVLNFDKLLGKCGQPVDGTIGFTTLKHYILTIDYPQKKLLFDWNMNNQSNDYSDVEWHDFVYINDSHLIGVPVKINGSESFDFVLDTGAGGTVITKQLADKLQLETQPFPGIVKGVGGEAKMEIALLKAFNIAMSTQENMQIIATDLDNVAPKAAKIKNGIIGYNFLRNYKIILDYPNQRFSLI